MHRNEILKSVIKIIAERLNLPKEAVAPEMSVGDVPAWGSMAQMEIITAVQNQFGVEIPIEDLFDMTSVEDIVNEVVKLKES